MKAHRPNLLEQQTWLQSAIAAPVPALALPGAGEYLQASPQLDAGARLAIYQRSYRARLLQSFHAIFPGLLHAMGGPLLDAFALEHLAAHRPRHHSVNRVADGFADHLARTRPPPDMPGAADWADFLVDLARLETALVEISEAPGLEHASGSTRANTRHLSDAQLQACRPAPSPCLRLLACSHPVHHYMQALRAGDAPTLPQPQPVWLALTRIDYRLSTRELAPVQWELLRRLDGTTTLHEALSAAQQLQLRPTPDLALARIWLGNFLAQGLLASAGAELRS